MSFMVGRIMNAPCRRIHCCAGLFIIGLLLGIPDRAAADLPVETELEDFFLIGTQPNTLLDPLYASGDKCNACHGGYEEEPHVAPYDRWRASAMAQSARDPLFHAALAIANQDASFSGDLCLRCHAPLGWLEGRSTPTDGSGLINADFDGVTCHLCHRMVDPVYDAMNNPAEDQAILNALAMDESNDVPTVPHTGQYVIDPMDRRRGPFNLMPGFMLHEWRRSPFHREALLCSTCHEVSNPAYERVGGPTPSTSDIYTLSADNTAHPTQEKYDMFPVERTFSEWSLSTFAQGPIEMGGRFGGNITAVSTCQDCHMPDASGYACAITSLAVYRNDLPVHDFLGATNWMLDAVINLDQSLELWGPTEVSGLTQTMVDEAKARNFAFLQAASDMELTVADDMLTVRVINQTGHKLPTGYPEGRRMWINARFFDKQDVLVQEYGAYDPSTAMLTEDTKIYEGRLGIDAAVAAATGIPEGETFHFALNNKWYKDNRIPPRGFTNAGFESVQAAPVAYAYADGQYWDDTALTIPCDAASAEVTLYYQTSSREYIEFLKNENTTNNAGDVLHDQWVITGKSAPLEMDFAVISFPDCNANSTFDACDIDQSTSTDVNGNGFPDECETPAAAAPGNRYLSITPHTLGAAEQVALRITASDFPCWQKYVDAAGLLVDDPVYQTPEAWETVVVTGDAIQPGHVYDVAVEFSGGALSAPDEADTGKWGDVDRNGVTNFADVLRVVKVVQGDLSLSPREAADLAPCIPNGVVNFSDVLFDIKAVQAQPFTTAMSCPQPCS